jgi:hypothetical protein
MEGQQYGFRIGYWPTSFFDLGLDITAANNLSGSPKMDFTRYHIFARLHLRVFKYIHPYVIGSFGNQIEPNKNIYDLDSDFNLSYIEKAGATLKFGTAIEIRPFSFAIESGGGNMGTGHIETNFTLSYALKPLPTIKPITDFRVLTGLHSIVTFIGPYKGEENYPGVDFSLELDNDGKTREYNVGIFFTDYVFSTGCFNVGTGWRLSGNKLYDYLDITPGIQILIWAEGEPDIILPAGSLGLGLHYQIWKLVPFINTRTIATIGNGNTFILGTTYTYGIGIVF